MGKAKNTLRLIKDRTRCISLEVGGARGDKRRPVRIKAYDMRTVVAVKEIVCGLESAHGDKVEVQRRTMLIETGEWMRGQLANETTHLGGRPQERTDAVQKGPDLSGGTTSGETSHDHEGTVGHDAVSEDSIWNIRTVLTGPVSWNTIGRQSPYGLTTISTTGSCGSRRRSRMQRARRRRTSRRQATTPPSTRRRLLGH